MPKTRKLDRNGNADSRNNFRGGTPLGDYDVVAAWDKEWAEMDDDPDGYNDGGWR